MDGSAARRLDRRTVLALGPAVGLAGLLAACGAGSGAGTGAAAGSGTAAPLSAGPAADLPPALRNLAARAPLCVPTADTTEGPYWFDVDQIRADLREDRTGVTAHVALRVQDLERCGAEPDGAGLPGVAVEVWHCDAAGIYSGYEAGSRAAAGGPDAPPPPPPPEPDEFTVSRGQYSAGLMEHPRSDPRTYLRGAQVTDEDGFVQFTTVFPGWYTGRAPHIHIRLHRRTRLALTTQLYVEQALAAEVYTAAPDYRARGLPDTANADDGIYHPSGLAATERDGQAVLIALNLGIDP